jgi:hypothetical protein
MLFTFGTLAVRNVKSVGSLATFSTYAVVNVTRAESGRNRSTSAS